MRIGINALYLLPGQVGGTEIYLRSLLAAMAAVDSGNEYYVFVNRETGIDLVPAAPRFHLVRCNVRARIRTLRILYEQSVLPCLLAVHRIDAVLNPGFTAPVFSPCASVTVFHDLQHQRFPRFFRRRELPFWRLLLWQAAATSRSLIAVSEATARDIAAFMPRHAEKVTVVPHGVDPAFFGIGERRLKRAPERYILAVSTLHPHKNLDRLLDAFGEFLALGSDYRLVIAGMRGLAAGRLEKQASKRLPRGRVVFTGWMPRDRLYLLFENADAFIFPSLFEGFGLPLVEALATGLPTACSDIPVFDALAGDAAIRFDPLSVAEIGNALRRITSDRSFRARAATAGPEQARSFSWHRTAAMTLFQLRKAAGVRFEDPTDSGKIVPRSPSS